MLPKWSPQLSTIVGIMDMGISNMLNTQLAYCIVNGSYIPVAAMLDTEISDENCYKQDRKLTKIILANLQ